jgi:hypothetical protein
LKNTRKHILVSGICTLEIENRNKESEGTMEMVREPSVDQHFEVEIDGSNSRTKRFECADTIVGEYRSEMDGPKVPVMDRAVPWIGTQESGPSSLDMHAYIEDRR